MRRTPSTPDGISFTIRALGNLDRRIPFARPGSLNIYQVKADRHTQLPWPHLPLPDSDERRSSSSASSRTATRASSRASLGRASSLPAASAASTARAASARRERRAPRPELRLLRGSALAAYRPRLGHPPAPTSYGSFATCCVAVVSKKQRASRWLAAMAFRFRRNWHGLCAPMRAPHAGVWLRPRRTRRRGGGKSRRR